MMPLPETAPPFVIRLYRQEERIGASFRPEARVEITALLRTTGLLLSLPAEDLRTLLTVLTFAHPNGHVLPSLVEVAGALRLPRPLAQRRLRRLEQFSWQGRPILHELRRESGLHAYAPSPRVLGTECERAEAPPLGQSFLAAGRTAVVGHSRAAYGRPRAEVEREIASRNGWPLPDAPAENPAPISSANPGDEPDYLKQRMLRVGVPGRQADILLARYPWESVRRQLDWLPRRNARDPARFLCAAISGDFGPPREPAAITATDAPADA